MAAIRSALGKLLGKNIKSVFSNTRAITHPVFSVPTATQHLFSDGCTTQLHVFSAPVGYCSTSADRTNPDDHQPRTTWPKRCTPEKAREYRAYFRDMDRRLEAGRFAVEEYNKIKYARLQFVSVLKAHRLYYDERWMDFLILEAIDATGTMNIYVAHLFPNFTGGKFLEFFGLLREEGNPVKLFDVLGAGRAGYH